MIRELLPRIREMALRLERKGARTGAVDAEDLEQAGAISLLRARETFDPRKGTSWRTYALSRAGFAMIDALRELDHVPRIERYRARRDGRFLRKVVSRDALLEENVERLEHEDLRSVGPAAAAGSRDAWAGILRSVGERQAKVLDGYFRRDMTLKEIGRALGISESRTCQLLAKALTTIRRRTS